MKFSLSPVLFSSIAPLNTSTIPEGSLIQLEYHTPELQASRDFLDCAGFTALRRFEVRCCLQVCTLGQGEGSMERLRVEEGS